jgi:hypothetical protein
MPLSRPLRSHFTAAARALLVVLGVTTMGPLLHGVHEDGCDPAFVLHDERQHGIQTPAAPPAGDPADDHCVACHFARASRGVAAWEPSGRAGLIDGVLLPNSDGHVAATYAAAPLPARAPPRA